MGGEDRLAEPARTDPNDPFASRIEGATESVTVGDGRTLAYATFGDPAGEPVFVFHGGIGSRGMGLLFDEAAAVQGLRIIAPDRPGYGRSDPRPDRALTDWPTDVAALADALDIDRFAVLGVSGGGPYAAACAAALPDRVAAAALVSSMGPPGSPMPRGLRVLVRLARLLPPLPRFVLGRQLRRAREDPDAAIAKRASGAADPEQAMHHSEAGRILNAQTAEGGRQGSAAAAREIRLVGSDWGFDLGTIEAPVGIWHGSLDRTIPVAMAEDLHERIPGSMLTVHDDVGHLSLPVSYQEEILGVLGDSRS